MEQRFGALKAGSGFTDGVTAIDRAYTARLERKIGGFPKPSRANEEAFARAVDEVTEATRRLVDSLVTTAPPKDREVEAERRKARAAERFATA